MINPFAPPESAPSDVRDGELAPGLKSEPYSFIQILTVAWSIWVENLATIAGSLVAGQWWRTALFLFGFAIIMLMCHSAAGFAGGMVPFEGAAGTAITVAIDTAGDIAASFTTVALVVFFLNLDHLSSRVQMK
jgi:hypothetical protein